MLREEVQALPTPTPSPLPINPPLPACLPAEEAMLREEVQALSSELREVVEARHVLRAVRDEAAQAIQAVRCVWGWWGGAWVVGGGRCVWGGGG